MKNVVATILNMLDLTICLKNRWTKYFPKLLIQLFFGKCWFNFLLQNVDNILEILQYFFLSPSSSRTVEEWQLII
jgi:hypothetical protein